MPSIGVLPSTDDTLALQRKTLPQIQGQSHLLRDYAELFKLRVTVMIGAAAGCGAWLAAHGHFPAIAASAIVGPVLAIMALAAGSAALNEILERESDAKMSRTARRPLVTRRISVPHALTVSLLLGLTGIGYLALRTNWLTAGLAFFTATTYLAIYTPLKQITAQCATIGAIPGAMPAVLGWAAVRGTVGLEALALFGVMFCWQFPHFYAIALLYRDDYERAGIRMLPLIDPDARFTIALIRTFSVILVLTSVVLGVFNPHPATYICVALLLGSGLLASTLSLSRERTDKGYRAVQAGARNVLRATILYLLALFVVLIATQAG
jgi:heme o synthase